MKTIDLKSLMENLHKNGLKPFYAIIVSIFLSLILTIFGGIFFAPNAIAITFASLIKSLYFYYTLAFIIWIFVFGMICLAIYSKNRWIRIVNTVAVFLFIVPLLAFVLLIAPAVHIEAQITALERIYNPNFNVPILAWPPSTSHGYPLNLWIDNNHYGWYVWFNQNSLIVETPDRGAYYKEMKDYLKKLIKSDEIDAIIDEYSPPFTEQGYALTVYTNAKEISGGRRVTINIQHSLSQCDPISIVAFTNCKQSLTKYAKIVIE